MIFNSGLCGSRSPFNRFLLVIVFAMMASGSSIIILPAFAFSGEDDSVSLEKGRGRVDFIGRRSADSRPDQDKSFRTGDVDLKKTTVTYLEIDRKDIEAKAQTLGETLDKEAGIQVRNSGGTGGFSSVSLRGSESSQVMIFMDGIPLSSASETGVDLGAISLGDIEKIEVFKGFTPMNFGMASMGGAVNINTLRSRPGMSGFFSAGAGSFGTRSYSGYFNHKPGAWDYLISFDSLSADNDYEIDNDNGTPFNANDDSKEKRRNAQIRQNSLLAKTGLDLGDRLRIDVQDQYFSKNQGIPSYASYNDAENNAWLETTRNIFGATIRADDVSPLLLSTRTRISHTMKNEEYDDRGNNIGLGVQHSKYDTDSLEAGFYAEWKNVIHCVEIVTESRTEEFRSDDLVAGNIAQDAERKSFSAGIQDRVIIDSEGRLIAAPGIRYSLTTDDGRSYTGEGDGFASDDRYCFSPQMGLVYTPDDSVTLKTNIAKYYRDPSFFELFGDRGFFEGNPRLAPERGINFDAGAEYRTKRFVSWAEELFFGATYFHDRIYDLITRTYDARGVGISVNVPGALVRGIEGIAGIKFAGRTGLYLSAVFQDPENLSGGLKGKKLPGRFESKYTLRAETGNDCWMTYAELTGENDMHYDTPNLLKAEDRRLINMGAEYGFRDLIACFDLKNITDERYSDFRLYPSPGRSFLFTLKYRFSDLKDDKR